MTRRAETSSSTADGVEIAWASDRHLRIRVGADTSDLSHARVMAALRRLGGVAARLPVLDLTPAYNTVLVTFDLARLADADAAEATVRAAVGNLNTAADTDAATSRTVEIAAWYDDPAVAADLAEVARLTGLSASDIARIHGGANYTVRFLGFSPGFPYLSGLPKELHVPRLVSPRTRVPAGSVAIAGDQCGIYPHATPGGWRLIARTPVRLFDPGRASRGADGVAGGEGGCLLRIGDRVRFVPVTAERFAELSAMRGGAGVM